MLFKYVNLFLGLKGSGKLIEKYIVIIRSTGVMFIHCFVKKYFVQIFSVICTLQIGQWKYDISTITICSFT